MSSLALPDRRLLPLALAMALLLGMATAPAGAVDGQGAGCNKLGLGAAVGVGAIGARVASRLGREGGEAAVRHGDALLDARRAVDDAPARPSPEHAPPVAPGGEAVGKAWPSEEIAGKLAQEGPGLFVDLTATVLERGAGEDSGTPQLIGDIGPWSDGLPARIAYARVLGDELSVRVHASRPVTILAYAVADGVPALDMAAPAPDRISVAHSPRPADVRLPVPPGGDEIVVVVVDVNEAGRLRVLSMPVLARRPKG